MMDMSFEAQAVNIGRLAMQLTGAADIEAVGRRYIAPGVSYSFSRLRPCIKPLLLLAS